MNWKKFIEKRWYEFAFLYLWIVVSTILCFGTMLIRFEFNLNYLYFYPIMGVILFVLYLFGFVYTRLDKISSKRGY